MSSDTIPPPTDIASDVPEENGFLNFLNGKNRCGINADGTKETMSGFAWFFLVLLLLGIASSTAVVISGKGTKVTQDQDNNIITKEFSLTKSQRIVATINLLVMCLTAYIFYAHAQNCAAWQGFGILVVITLIMQVLIAGIDNPTAE